MISIPRSILRAFRALVRKAGLHKRRISAEPAVLFVADSEGCRIQTTSPDMAVEYRHIGPFDAQSYCLPLTALDPLASKGDGAVTVEAQGATRALVTWMDHGVPRQVVHDAPKFKPFPTVPTAFAANDPSLWSALRDAVPVCDSGSSRYALGCLHLRGPLGRIDTTDGRHVLSQSGFTFPWDDEILIPASAILGCPHLDGNEPIAVGRAGEWIGFRIGNWQILVRCQEGRFPKLDEIIPKPEAAGSRLELSPGDATFLADVLPRLPFDDPQYEPITFDLNDQVLVRARESSTSRPTEVELTESRLHGDPTLLNTDRRYVAQALRLGFRNVHCFGTGKAVLSCDDRRQYLWMPLDDESAIKSHADPVRIERRVNGPAATPNPTFPEKPMSAPPTAGQPTSTKKSRPNSENAKNRTAKPIGSPIEQAAALRTALIAVARQAGELIRTLKRHKRQAKLVQSTLDSLKQLQKVAA